MSKPTILLVDDDPIQNELTTAYLRRLTSATIVIAEDGARAQRMITVVRQDLVLIICDINMPTLDGIELIQLFAAEGLRTPVLLLTGAHDSLMRGAQELALINGLNLIGALRKPLTAAALANAVKPVLGSMGAP
jgi:CheY-like chemotaxis protein